MDTTSERVAFIENLTWDELVAEENRAYDIKALRAERDNLRAENDGLKAQLTEAEAQLKATEEELKTSEAKLKSAKLDLEDMKISFECVRTMLAYYMKFTEALNPSKKAFENAMKKMKKE